MKDWEDYKGKHCLKWIQLCEKIRSEVDAEELDKAEQFATDLIERWKDGEDVVLVQQCASLLIQINEKDRLSWLLEDFKNVEEDLIPGGVGAEIMED